MVPRMSTYNLYRKIRRSAPFRTLEEACQWRRNNSNSAAEVATQDDLSPIADVPGDRCQANKKHHAAVAQGIERNLEIPALSPKSTRGG